MNNALKVSGYDPWCLHSTSRMSWMTHCATPVCTPVCKPDFSNGYISAKIEDIALKPSGYDVYGSKSYTKIIMDDPLCVPLFVPQNFQMLLFQPKMKIRPQNLQDMILGVYKIHQERQG